MTPANRMVSSVFNMYADRDKYRQMIKFRLVHEVTVKAIEQVYRPYEVSSTAPAGTYSETFGDLIQDSYHVQQSFTEHHLQEMIASAPPHNAPEKVGLPQDIKDSRASTSFYVPAEMDARVCERVEKDIYQMLLNPATRQAVELSAFKAGGIQLAKVMSEQFHMLNQHAAKDLTARMMGEQEQEKDVWTTHYGDNYGQY